MWITKAKWEWLKSSIEQWKAHGRSLQETVGQMASRNATLSGENADLRQRLDALRDRVAHASASEHKAELYRVRVNALEIERAKFLAILLKTDIVAPQIGGARITLTPPGADFEDSDINENDSHDTHPLRPEADLEKITDLIGDLDGPALAPGRVVRDADDAVPE